MGEMQIDSLSSCGIFRIENTVGNDYEFKCLVPSDIKEEDVSDYITAILLSIKDKVATRKSWRFKEKSQKNRKKEIQKVKIQKVEPKIVKKPRDRRGYNKSLGMSVGDALREAGIK